MNRIKRIMGAVIATAIIASGSSSCSSVSPLFHEYMMSGNIVDVLDDNVVVVCIGTADGAKEGQTLIVHRTESYEGGGGDYVTYGRVEVGKVRVQSIINEHYARAEVVAGEVEKYDHVQLIDP
ncbi:MAG: hypothetical protein NXI24_25050 [bacterium]|nr:hypothetical protein [bacterium]